MWRLLRQAPPELLFGARTTTPSENSTDEDPLANWTIYWNITDFSQRNPISVTITTLIASSVSTGPVSTYIEPFDDTSFGNVSNITAAPTEPPPPREASKRLCAFNDRQRLIQNVYCF